VIGYVLWMWYTICPWEIKKIDIDKIGRKLSYKLYLKHVVLLCFIRLNI
jgi:hypothetical protein